MDTNKEEVKDNNIDLLVITEEDDLVVDAIPSEDESETIALNGVSGK